MSERFINGHGIRTIAFGLAMAFAAYFGRGWVERQDQENVIIHGDYKEVTAALTRLERDVVLINQREQFHHDELRAQVDLINRKLEALLARRER